MTFVVLDFFQTLGVPVWVDEDFRLRHVEIEAAVGHALRPEPSGNFPKRANPRLEVLQFSVSEIAQRAAGGASLVFGWQRKIADFLKIIREQEGVGLFVSQALAGANDGVRVGGGLGFAVFGKGEKYGFAEAVLGFDE